MIDKLTFEDMIPSLAVGTKWKEYVSPIIGTVTLELTDLNTGKCTHRSSHNQVVYIGRHNIMRIVCGGTVDSASKVINTLRIADGAVLSGGDQLNPTPPAITDTGLFQTNTANIKTFTVGMPSFNTQSGATYPTATYTLTVTTQDILGVMNEVGMFFGPTGPMFAHYTFPTLDMRAGTNNSLKIDWEFDF